MHLAWASGVWQWCWCWSLYKLCVLGNRNRSTAIYHLYTYTAPQPQPRARLRRTAYQCRYPMCLCVVVVVVGARGRRTKYKEKIANDPTRCPSEFLVVICPYLGPSASPASVAASLDQGPLCVSAPRGSAAADRLAKHLQPPLTLDQTLHRKGSALSSSPLSAFGDLSSTKVCSRVTRSTGLSSRIGSTIRPTGPSSSAG
jgi:hypothetical protein